MKFKLSKALFISILTLLISSVHAQQCNISSLNSSADVEKAQRCIKTLQEDFERLLGNYKVVLKEIDDDLFSLLAQEANCIVIEKGRKTNPAITQTMVRDCERLSKEYSIKWSQAGSNFQKLMQTQDLTKEHIEALKLKFKQLEGVVGQFRAK
jgi:hypothetical protein